MRTEIIETKLDGLQPFFWWDKEDFKGRSQRILDLDSGKVLHDAPFPDELVVCDFCDAKITTFPVPVLNNSYALCPDCFKKVKK